MIKYLAIEGYRSLRDLRINLGPLNVVTGSNGVGKSSLYRALRLLADVAQGRLIGALALEGGLESILWAGPEQTNVGKITGFEPTPGSKRKNPIALKLGFSGDGFGYGIDLGLPVNSVSMFARDPDIKAEALWSGPSLTRSNRIAERTGPLVRVCSHEGDWHKANAPITPQDSMLTQCADSRDGIDLLLFREALRSWRFYDHLRTDRDAPARAPQVGTRTPVLAGDGSDLAAAVQTILEVGDGRGLREAVAAAFDGAILDVVSESGRLQITLSQPGLFRPLLGAELSEGTLRYILLLAALYSPRPPPLMVLNEPEASLHPALLVPLGQEIVMASKHTQMIVITHGEGLAREILRARGRPIVLKKNRGETEIVDEERFSWAWPSR